VGATLLFSTIQLEGRVAQNQMMAQIDAVIQSNIQNFSTIQLSSFSGKAEKALSQVPVALGVESFWEFEGTKECIGYGFDNGAEVHFLHNCFIGDEYDEFVHLTMSFEELDYTGCNSCQDDLCGGRPCSGCKTRCQATYMNVHRVVEATNYTLSQEDPEVEKRDDDTLVQACQGMGKGPGRLLQVTTDNIDMLYAFTPATEILSDPPQDMTLICEVKLTNNMEIFQVTTSGIQDTANTGTSLSAVVIPFFESRPEFGSYFLVYCDLKSSSNPAEPGQTWQVRLLWRKSFESCMPEQLYAVLEGLPTCPDTADIDMRQLDNGIWEVVVVTIFNSARTLNVFSVFIDQWACTSETHQIYNYYLDEDTQKVMSAGQVTTFGDFVNIYFPRTSSTTRQVTADTDVTLLINIKNTQSSWVSQVTWADWKVFTTYGDFGNLSIPSVYVTSFPNNNVRVSQETVRDAQAHFFGESIWFAWEDENSATGNVTIYGCPPGQQFIVDVSGSQAVTSGCFPCPPGQFKNSSQIGENCQLCPSKTYSNVSGSTSSDMCTPCSGSAYCPSGMNSLTAAQNFGQTTFSCTNPWFEGSDDVDVEGSFYINQGILIFILCMFVLAICLTFIYGTQVGTQKIQGFGVWMWDMDEEEPDGKKTLYGIAGWAAAVAYMLLVIMVLYLLIGHNTYIGTSVDVENAVRSSYPDQFDELTKAPLYFSLTFYGEVAICDKTLFSFTSIGFFDPETGAKLDPKLLSAAPVPSTTGQNDTISQCRLTFEISRSLTSLSPEIQISYDPRATSSYVNRVEIDVSTGLQDNGQLQSCTQDVTVTDKDDLGKICNEPGYSFASILLTASENRALRGSADLTIVKTLGIVENCKSEYNTYPWSFVLTKSNCEWCNSSTTLLFPSVVKSALLESTFYYERDPALNFTITLTEDNFARTGSISRYFSIGSALLTIIITGGGVLDMFALFLALGTYGYIYTVARYMEKSDK